ncbi:tripartite tricarboxylate transporter substrate-binding protein [Piscinibacter sp. HJYY11]|uniref:tripartite tricarboxylate transporter substrate-binding protein n=1 Tax=Piscinibacter sp. HJYY11 TaxID=2801333 RepID=UPI00191D8726|nr:tripartite tricarboxylate transporter substrate-binding protein [Piscinibacter sp. HJYY11]MBL0729955.1 twin-arginine translocation pathway signal protein [Piscinibacter sp. HJYY11]
MTTRRHFLLGACGVALGPWSAPSTAAEPLSLARILLGAPAGGAGDLMARRLADKLAGGYASKVIVENRPGAGGQLAITALKDAPDDGSTLLLTPSSLLSIYPYTYARLPYKPQEDLAPVSLAAYSNHALGVGPAVPLSVKTLKDFLAWAKAHPELASYGSPASGSIPHLIMVVLAKLTHVPLRHIPYRGSTQGLQDLRGGQLAAMSSPVGAFLPHLASGQVRLLAVSGDQRSPFVKDVPTYRQLGYPITAREWYGFFVPAKTRAAMVTRSAAYLRMALSSPDVAEGIRQFGLEAAHSTPQQLAEMLKADSQEWRSLIRTVGFTAES